MHPALTRESCAGRGSSRLCAICCGAKPCRIITRKQLPESVSWNDLMYELYVKQKIEEGLQQLDEGRGISHEEAKRRLLGESS